MHFGLTAMKNNPLAVVIVSNGPGELSTWVKPVINELNKINETLPEKNILPDNNFLCVSFVNIEIIFNYFLNIFNKLSLREV